MYSDTESDILEFMDEYIKALGLTEDEYWNDYKVKENQRYLLHLKVKSYLSEHPEDVIDVSKLQVKLQSSKYSKRRCIAEYINNKNAF